MTASELGVLIPALTALVIAVTALWKNHSASQRQSGTNAVAETREALASMGKLNDMLMLHNSNLEMKITRLEAVIDDLRERMIELQKELESWRH